MEVGVRSSIVAARPSFELDGTDRPELSDGLIALSVEETTEGLYCCEATFNNWGVTGSDVGFLYLDRETFDFGTEIVIRATDGEDEAQIFGGVVTGLESAVQREQPATLSVLAEDRLQTLRMTRRTRTFEDATDRDVFEQIAREQGLQSDLDVDGPSYRVLAQVNQSDLAFVRDRAQAIGAEVWLEDGTLRVQSRARREADDLTLVFGRGLQAFTVLADVARQRTGYAVTGWDVTAKESIEHTATESAIQGELNGGESGAAALERALGSHDEQEVHRVPLSTQEAQAIAEACFRQQARRFVCGEGVAEGDARLRVGARVSLDGVGDPFTGAYTVTRVRHTFDQTSGYRTHFRVERPFVN